MKILVPLPADKITVVRWNVPAARPSQLHDCRSAYAERFWLGVLGPSTTMLLRHLSNELDASPVGFVLHYEEVAVQLGIRGTGKNSPFMKAMQRLFQFEVGDLINPNRMQIRTDLPTLGTRYVAKLPASLRLRHDYYATQQNLESA